MNTIQHDIPDDWAAECVQYLSSLKPGQRVIPLQQWVPELALQAQQEANLANLAAIF